MVYLTGVCVLGWTAPAVALSVSAAKRGLPKAVYFGIGCMLGPVLSLALVHTQARPERSAGHAETLSLGVSAAAPEESGPEPGAKHAKLSPCTIHACPYCHNTGASDLGHGKLVSACRILRLSLS